MIGQEGCEGFSSAADRATGNCAIVSLWNSKRSLERSEQAIAAIRTATVEAVDAELDGIVIAEVLRELKVRPTHVGAQARVVRIAAPAGKAEELVDFYDTEVVPRLKSQPGFLNSRLIRDLEHHGRFSAVSHWTDTNALKSSDSSTAVGKSPKREPRSSESRPPRSSSPTSSRRHDPLSAIHNNAAHAQTPGYTPHGIAETTTLPPKNSTEGR